MRMIRILYFDDEKWLSVTLHKNLQESYPQYSVTRVGSIENFFDELESVNKFDVIMLDIMVPMSLIVENEKVRSRFTNVEIKAMAEGAKVGEILYQKVRKIKSYKSTPILFYSAKRTVNIQNYNTAFLRKPEFVEVIHEKIQLMLKK